MKTALPAPRPIDALDLPADLDGRHGTNRADGHRLVAAHTDLDAVRAWLARFAGTKTTFDSYRKEAERLLLWSVLQRGKPLSSPIRNPPHDGPRTAGANTPAMIRAGGRSTARCRKRASARRW
jgi:hypothetical protein